MYPVTEADKRIRKGKILQYLGLDHSSSLASKPFYSLNKIIRALVTKKNSLNCSMDGDVSTCSSNTCTADRYKNSIREQNTA
jgi:hypothetical protein